VKGLLILRGFSDLFSRPLELLSELFSGFYLALMLMLVALIVRASEQTIAAIAMIPHNFSVLQFSTFLE
jgi:hypothetical protein